MFLILVQTSKIIPIQINKLTKKIYSNLLNINIHYYLKLQIPIRHHPFVNIPFQNPEDIQTQCNVRKNPFQFACRKWYSYNIPQCSHSIITRIRIKIFDYLYKKL